MTPEEINPTSELLRQQQARLLASLDRECKLLKAEPAGHEARQGKNEGRHVAHELRSAEYAVLHARVEELI